MSPARGGRRSSRAPRALARHTPQAGGSLRYEIRLGCGPARVLAARKAPRGGARAPGTRQCAGMPSRCERAWRPLPLYRHALRHPRHAEYCTMIPPCERWGGRPAHAGAGELSSCEGRLGNANGSHHSALVPGTPRSLRVPRSWATRNLLVAKGCGLLSGLRAALASPPLAGGVAQASHATMMPVDCPPNRRRLCRRGGCQPAPGHRGLLGRQQEP